MARTGTSTRATYYEYTVLIARVCQALLSNWSYDTSLLQYEPVLGKSPQGLIAPETKVQ